MNYLVVDGYALAYRAWYAYPEMKNNQGRDTRVTVGFFKQLLSKIKNLSDYRWIFVFDSPGGSFRKGLSEQYKANRARSPQTFYDQVEEIVKLCRIIAPTYRIPDYEADDLAGSFVSQMSPDSKALLLTVDGDWLQLLDKNVEVLQLKTVGHPVHWTRELFFERNSGLTPKQLVDIKALLGDESDNIPGIKGVGWVTVNKLLREYNTIEGIYDNILKIPNKGNVQTKLIENKDQVFLSKKLATIKTDIPLVIDDTWLGDTDAFLDYVLEELNAQNLANLLGVYFQLHREEYTK